MPFWGTLQGPRYDQTIPGALDQISRKTGSFLDRLLNLKELDERRNRNAALDLERTQAQEDRRRAEEENRAAKSAFMQVATGDYAPEEQQAQVLRIAGQYPHSDLANQLGGSYLGKLFAPQPVNHLTPEEQRRAALIGAGLEPKATASSGSSFLTPEEQRQAERYKSSLEITPYQRAQLDRQASPVAEKLFVPKNLYEEAHRSIYGAFDKEGNLLSKPYDHKDEIRRTGSRQGAMEEKYQAAVRHYLPMGATPEAINRYWEMGVNQGSPQVKSDWAAARANLQKLGLYATAESGDSPEVSPAQNAASKISDLPSINPTDASKRRILDAISQNDPKLMYGWDSGLNDSQRSEVLAYYESLKKQYSQRGK
jgi:hypothetical protein